MRDEAARKLIREDLGATLFVEAGAGSGKTTALVSRVVALIATGTCTLQQIAAITFSEAAAAELRVRERELLEAVASSTETGLTERAACRAALDHIDESAISTIHGYCQRILAAHPIEAGLPPRFEVLDEVNEAAEWRARWSIELDRLGDDEMTAGLLAVAWALGVGPAKVEELARAVDDVWHRCQPGAPDVRAALRATEEIAAVAAREVVLLLRSAVAERHRCIDPADGLLERLAEIDGYAARLDGAVTAAEMIPLLLSARPKLGVGRCGRAESWDGHIDSVREVVLQADGRRTDAIAQLSEIVLRPLVHLLDGRARLAAEQRRRGGRLTFHDLLVFTRDVLRDDASVRRAVRARHTRLLVDEFQDTDPLQLEIVRLIGAEEVGGPLDEGRCYFVGDPKQSIYRFRGADLAAYETARAQLVGGETTLLTSNFRSVPGVLAFVNACFEPLLGDRFESLDPVRPAAGDDVSGDGRAAAAASGLGGPPVAVLGSLLPPEVKTVAQQRQIECKDVALMIEAVTGASPWLVHSGDDDEGWRPARRSDIAILIPRRTGLAELETALDRHDIGYRVESASLIFRSQEVRDVLALGRAIEEPGDQVALLATLRSPAFSIGDDELTRFSASGGRWTIEEAPADDQRAAAPRVAAAFEELARFRDELPRLGAAATLALAVRDRRLMQIVARGTRERESWRRMRYVLDRLRTFVASGGGGLGEFADWIEDQLRGGSRSAESVVPEADEDVVRIMTVHGAKGLEFPIVFLCGFGTTGGGSNQRAPVLRNAADVAEVYCTGRQTVGYEDLRLAEERLEDEEAVRLLYVAATRAEDHLVICGHHGSTRAGTASLTARLLAAADEHPDLWEQVPSTSEGAVVGEIDGAPISAAASAPAVATEAAGGPLSASGDMTPAERTLATMTIEQYEAWRAEREATLLRACRQASVRATEVAGLAGLAPAGTEWRDEDPAGGDFGAECRDDDGGSGTGGTLPQLGGPRRRGRAGTQIGRAVHATLQSVSLDDAISLGAAPDVGDLLASAAGERLHAIADSQARAERVADRTDEIARLAVAALRSDVVRAAFTSGTARRELYVARTVGTGGGVVIDGFVDLCFEDGDGLVVVDYKTDSVRDLAEVAAASERYELQAAAYAVALGAAAERPVHRCVLVFLSPPSHPIEHEISGDHLRTLTGRVREIVAGVGLPATSAASPAGASR